MHNPKCCLVMCALLLLVLKCTILRQLQLFQLNCNKPAIRKELHQLQSIVAIRLHKCYLKCNFTYFEATAIFSNLTLHFQRKLQLSHSSCTNFEPTTWFIRLRLLIFQDNYNCYIVTGPS